jgi:hypothetical protein
MGLSTVAVLGERWIAAASSQRYLDLKASRFR